MATQLTGPVTIAAQSLFSSSADKLHRLGEIIFSNDGRAYRYAKAGGTTLVIGKLQQSAAEVTADQDVAIAAAAIGATQIVTTGTLTVTANQYAEGLAVVCDDTGEGYQYLISSHAAATAAVVTFNLSDPIVIALTTSTTIDFVRNPYSAVIVNPTTLTSSPVGVCIYPITNAQFGWLQVGGIATILADGANAVGANLVASNGVAGAVEDAATPGAQPLVGIAHTGAADTEYGAVKLQGLL